MLLPELGFLCLLLSMSAAIVQIFLNTFSIDTTRSRALVGIQCFSAFLSFLILSISFLQDDFSVWYVWQNSHTTLPWYYKLTAVWGAHEGSILLWYVVLSCWTAYFFAKNRLEEALSRSALVFLSILQSLFSFFIVAISSPFERLLFPVPSEGLDLNPLLQDVGFIIHPPILYLGYVGLAVPFAIAFAAAVNRQPLPTKMMLNWLRMPLAFLTVGIVLGSWWAYYELGWGGWWFWDPVENAALIPWLFACALLHFLLLAAKRINYDGWVYASSFCAFLSAIIGTFLVRSGILSSVHSFAADPSRGVFLLAIVMLTGLLGLLAGMRLLLKPKESLPLLSKPMLLWGNGLFLAASAVIVLFGTIYPLIIEQLANTTLSVGAPYYEQTVLPVWLGLSILCGLSAYLLYPKGLTRKAELFAGALISLYLGWHFGKGVMSMVWVAVGAWILWAVYFDIIFRLRTRKPMKRAFSMWFAHLGLGVAILGGTLVNLYEIEADVSLKKGEGYQVQDWYFSLDDERVEKTPHATHYIADFTVSRPSTGQRWSLHPEKQHFTARQITMTETAIVPGFWNDIYIALGERRPSGEWSCRLYIKPYIRWLWAGGLLMALGLVIGFIRKRS